MALRNRVLNVILHMPSGDVILDASINMKVRIHKAALALQNKATIDVIGLTQSLREQLLSQFTAFYQRQVVSAQVSQDWINMEIQAGWDTQINGDAAQPTTIFKGQVVICEPTSSPPNVGIRLSCFTRQIDRTTFISGNTPENMKFSDLVKWTANELGIGTNYVFDVTNDTIIPNPAKSIYTHAGLLIYIQDLYKPDVAAYFDDDILYVKDRNKIINQTSQITDFIGIPNWTEWGVEFQTLFDQSIKLAQGAALTSKMNPSLNKTYVILELNYDLATRDIPFYVKVGASPPSA